MADNCLILNKIFGLGSRRAKREHRNQFVQFGGDVSED
jgi:hypothetical protein